MSIPAYRTYVLVLLANSGMILRLEQALRMPAQTGGG